jgi:tetratricopeptide (TPR) repeat protein
MFVFRKKNKNGKKIDQLLTLTRKDPENPAHRVRLADFYLRAGDKKSAIPEYQRAAKQLSGEGFNLKAISIYKIILNLGGMSLNDYKSLASLYTEEGLLAEAKRTYEKILQIDALDQDAQAALKDLERGGRGLRRLETRNTFQEDEIETTDNGGPVPIETLLAPSQDGETRSDPLHDSLGETLEEGDIHGLSDHTEASGENRGIDVSNFQVDDLPQSTQSLDEEKPNSIDTLDGKLLRDMDIADFSDSEETAEKTLSSQGGEGPEIDTSPINPSPLDSPQSSPSSSSEARSEPSGEDPNLHYHLGVAYREMELTDKAIEEFTKALQQGNNPLECLIMLAKCYFEKGLFQEAASLLHRALKLENLTQDQIGLLHQQLEDVEAVGKLS